MTPRNMPGGKRKNLCSLFNEEAERENVVIGSDFPERCSGHWLSDADAVHLNYPNYEYYYGRCEFSLCFFSNQELENIEIVSTPHDAEEYEDILHKIGAFALMYMDRSISHHEAAAFVRRLRQDESSGWKYIGCLKAYLVVDGGDADLVFLEIYYADGRSTY